MRCGVMVTSVGADQSLSLMPATPCLTCTNAKASRKRADTRADTAPSWVPPSPHGSCRRFWLMACPNGTFDFVAVKAVALLAYASGLGGIGDGRRQRSGTERDRRRG